MDFRKRLHANDALHPVWLLDKALAKSSKLASRGKSTAPAAPTNIRCSTKSSFATLTPSMAVFRTASLPPDHTFLQQLRKVGKRSRSPANLLVQFQLHLIFKPAWRAHPCAHQTLSRHPVWSFDKAPLKLGKLQSR
jgi:hypothetical protein